MEYIDGFLQMHNNYVFVWFCPGAGELEEESKSEMEQKLPHRTALSLDDVLRNGFSAGDTVLLNWEQVNRSTSKSITETEKTNLYEQIKRAYVKQDLSTAYEVMRIHLNEKCKTYKLV